MRAHLMFPRVFFLLSAVVALGSTSPAFAEAMFIGLGHLPGQSSSSASGVSADGSVVVGANGYPPRDEAFRWTSDGGMVGLGFLPGAGSFSRAEGVSADGSVVVGFDFPGSVFGKSDAFIWDETNGMRGLAQVLTELGVDLAGWHLSSANDVSDDGLTIVGSGTNPSGDLEAWIAVLPAPNIAVEIDIKPGNDLNPVNPMSRGVIPVAILGSDTFDVADVDTTTLAFGPNGAGLAHQNGPHVKDANLDDLGDLLAHFFTAESGIAFGDEEACVTGELLDGTPFEGCDTIATEPPCGRGYEAALLLAVGAETPSPPCGLTSAHSALRGVAPLSNWNPGSRRRMTARARRWETVEDISFTGRQRC